jgi:hypothetical protein
MELFRTLTPEDLTTLNQQQTRILGNVSENQLRLDRTKAYNQIDQLRRSSGASAKLASIDRIEVKTTYINSIEKELALRALEAGGYNKKNALDFAINAFIDSPLYQTLTTPFKRIIQSPQTPAKVKEYAIRLAGDSALNHAYSAVLGVPSTQSVHSRAQMRRGQVAAAYDNLHQIYRESYGVKDTRFLDIDLMNTARKVLSPQSLTLKTRPSLYVLLWVRTQRVILSISVSQASLVASIQIGVASKETWVWPLMPRLL